MDLKKLFEAYKVLASSRIASVDWRHRVAIRWVKAGMERDFDILMRLQVLEGAAGVPEDTWMKKQRAGLPMAQAYFADKGSPVNPEWFSATPTGMYQIIMGTIQKLITSLKLRLIDPVDILSNALMGLPMPGGRRDREKEVIARTCYAAGQKLSERILEGKETPVSAAKGVVSRYFSNRVWRDQRKEKKEDLIPVDEEGVTMDLPDPSSVGRPDEPGLRELTEKDFSEFLAYIVFRGEVLEDVPLVNPDGSPVMDPATHKQKIKKVPVRDPKAMALGQRVRDLMRASWEGSDPMILWLDILEQEHRYPKQNEIAQKSGINPAAFNARHWKPRWKKFFMDLRSASSLLHAIQKMAVEEGIDWDPSDLMHLDPEELLPSRSDRPKTSFRQTMVNRIASRYVLHLEW